MGSCRKCWFPDLGPLYLKLLLDHSSTKLPLKKFLVTESSFSPLHSPTPLSYYLPLVLDFYPGSSAKSHDKTHEANTCYFFALKRECFVHSKISMNPKKELFTFLYSSLICLFFHHSYLQITLGCSLDFSQFIISGDNRAAGM